eukprot:13519692-Heterocapsa_arctica.AAC.1
MHDPFVKLRVDGSGCRPPRQVVDVLPGSGCGSSGSWGWLQLLKSAPGAGSARYPSCRLEELGGLCRPVGPTED